MKYLETISPTLRCILEQKLQFRHRLQFFRNGENLDLIGRVSFGNRPRDMGILGVHDDRMAGRGKQYVHVFHWHRAHQDLIAQYQSTREATPVFEFDFDRADIWIIGFRW